MLAPPNYNLAYGTALPIFSILHNFGNSLVLDDRVRVVIPRYTIVMIRKFLALHPPQEFLVVRDHNQLKIGLCLSMLDDVL